jgi:hypothetical protein
MSEVRFVHADVGLVTMKKSRGKYGRVEINLQRQILTPKPHKRKWNKAIQGIELFTFPVCKGIEMRCHLHAVGFVSIEHSRDEVWLNRACVEFVFVELCVCVCVCVCVCDSDSVCVTEKTSGRKSKPYN